MCDRRRVRKTRKRTIVLQPPIWTGHADFVQPFEFIAFMRMLEGSDFDVMLEAKSKDLALVRPSRRSPRPSKSPSRPRKLDHLRAGGSGTG